MRLDIQSLEVQSFATATIAAAMAASGDPNVLSDEPSECDSQCWACSDSGLPSCGINMCETVHIPDTYLEPCTLQNLTCVGCA